METGALKDTFEDIIALAKNNECDEIIALCECELKEIAEEDLYKQLIEAVKIIDDVRYKNNNAQLKFFSDKLKEFITKKELSSSDQTFKIVQGK